MIYRALPWKSKVPRGVNTRRLLLLLNVEPLTQGALLSTNVNSMLLFLRTLRCKGPRVQGNSHGYAL